MTEEERDLWHCSPDASVRVLTRCAGALHRFGGESSPFGNWPDLPDLKAGLRSRHRYLGAPPSSTYTLVSLIFIGSVSIHIRGRRRITTMTEPDEEA